MANNKIQIKRSDTNSAPTGLMAGELAWSDNNASQGAGGAAGFLYIGDMTSAGNGGTSIRKIGGPGWGLELLHDANLTGTTAAGTAPTIEEEPAQFDGSLKIANTNYVDVAVANASPAMDDISDVSITSGTLAGGSMLLWNASNNEWRNQAMGGHVAINETGNTVVSAVGPDAVALGSMTTGAYVASIAHAASNDEILVTSSGGEGAAVTIGLQNNVVIKGDLTVNGTTTSVDSTVVSIADPVFVVGQNTQLDTKDRGMEFKYATGTVGNEVSTSGFFGWDQSAEAFTMKHTVTNSAGEIFTGTTGNAIFGNIGGTLTDGAQQAITEIGNITVGQWNGTVISPLRGGTGQDSSGATGVPVVNGGAWSFETNLDVSLGGTGLSTLTSQSLLVGNGIGNMHDLAAGSEGQMLKVISGSLSWSDSMDGGTWT